MQQLKIVGIVTTIVVATKGQNRYCCDNKKNLFQLFANDQSIIHIFNNRKTLHHRCNNGGKRLKTRMLGDGDKNIPVLLQNLWQLFFSSRFVILLLLNQPKKSSLFVLIT